MPYTLMPGFEAITLVNGQPANQLAVMDRGLLFGDGVFETMLLINGELPFWSLHHERLLKGAVYLGIHLESQTLRQSIDTLIEQARAIEERTSQDDSHVEQRFIIKVIVTRGQGSRGYGYQSGYQSGQTSTLIAQLFPYQLDSGLFDGVTAHICEQRLYPVSWAGLKTLNQLPYVLATGERSDSKNKERRQHSEGLLLNDQDQLIEATARNIFFVLNDKLVTPCLDNYGVAGVMRRYIIDDLAVQIGCTVIEREIHKNELERAEEVFLTNSISGIWPLLACDNYRWSVGPITRSLQSMCSAIFPHA